MIGEFLCDDDIVFVWMVVVVDVVLVVGLDVGLLDDLVVYLLWVVWWYCYSLDNGDMYCMCGVDIVWGFFWLWLLVGGMFLY